jgi:hypothetical protein
LARVWKLTIINLPRFGGQCVSFVTFVVGLNFIVKRDSVIPYKPPFCYVYAIRSVQSGRTLAQYLCCPSATNAHILATKGKTWMRDRKASEDVKFVADDLRAVRLTPAVQLSRANTGMSLQEVPRCRCNLLASPHPVHQRPKNNTSRFRNTHAYSHLPMQPRVVEQNYYLARCAACERTKFATVYVLG